MSQFLPRLVVVCTSLVIAASASPALAAGTTTGPPTQTVDTRALATSRVVERVEIGRLGEAQPFVVEQRTTRGKAHGRSPLFEVTASDLSIQSHSEACFWARPSWTRYNGFGKLASKAWYYIEWCGKNGVVSRVLTLYCDGVAGGGFSYGGCKVRRGSTGYSSVRVSGKWKYPFRVGIYTFVTRTITVSARHYSTGRYKGTWRMYQ